MTAVGELDFLGDEGLQRRLVRWSFALLGAGGVVGAGLWLAGTFDVAGEMGALRLGGIPPTLVWLVLLALVSVGVLPVHELVHGALFRLFGGPGTRVTFGAQAGMLYAGCPGLVLPRGRFCVVLAGPVALLSGALLAVPAEFGLPCLGYVAFVLHLAGCSGDLLALCRVLGDARCTHCEDTERGVRLLARAG